MCKQLKTSSERNNVPELGLHEIWVAKSTCQNFDRKRMRSQVLQEHPKHRQITKNSTLFWEFYQKNRDDRRFQTGSRNATVSAHAHRKTAKTWASAHQSPE